MNAQLLFDKVTLETLRHSMHTRNDRFRGPGQRVRCRVPLRADGELCTTSGKMLEDPGHYAASQALTIFCRETV